MTIRMLANKSSDNCEVEVRRCGRKLYSDAANTIKHSKYKGYDLPVIGYYWTNSFFSGHDVLVITIED